MSYPRNAASPERISIGALVTIADGSVATSGATISVIPQGGSAGAGGGTTSYENGIVCYLPLQAETNYTSFIVVAYKTGCIPASTTIITSASATPGYAGIDWSKVTAPTSTVGLTNTTVGVVTAVTGLTASDVGAIKTKTDYLPSVAAGGIGGVFIAGTNAATTITTALTTTFTGNLSGSVASVLGGIDTTAGTVKTLDAAITALGTAHGVGSWATATGFATPTNITAASGITVSALGANVITAASMDTDASAEIADAVWEELLAGHAGAGSAGLALATASSGGVDPGILAAAVWDEALAGHGTAGTAGKKLTDTALTQTFPTNFSSMVIAATGIVDANVQKINDVTITGDGASGTEFGV